MIDFNNHPPARAGNKCKHCGSTITLCEGEWLHYISMKRSCPPEIRYTDAEPA